MPLYKKRHFKVSPNRKISLYVDVVQRMIKLFWGNGMKTCSSVRHLSSCIVN